MESSVAEVVASFIHGVIYVGHRVHDSGRSSRVAEERAGAGRGAETSGCLYAVVR